MHLVKDTMIYEEAYSC